MRIPNEGRVFAAAIVALAGAGTASAETWNVNPEGTGDAPTLQAAIDQAQSGDTIRLAPGIYRDRVTRSVKGGQTTAVAFLKNGLIIMGEDASVTFLDGEEDHQCLVGENLGNDTKIRQLTLIHGDALDESSAAARGGGGLLLYDSSPELRDLRFVGCNSLDGGGGLRVLGNFGGQRLDVYGCAFIYCWSGGRGGGIEMVGLDDADVKWNTFAGNFSEVRGGGVAIVGFPAWVDNNVWWLNCAHEAGGSLWCEGADVVAECNVFWENIPEIDEEDLDCEAGVGVGAEPNSIADPLFCDIEAENFAVHSGSPASDKNSGVCGSIGAYEPACGLGPAHVSCRNAPLGEPLTAQLRVHASPNPVAADVRLAVTGLRAAEAGVEIFDIQGRRVRSLGRAGDAGLVWDGRDEAGVRVVAGIYFARAATGRDSVVARVVVLQRR